MKAIAIDGPAGAGKSTIARAVAQELQFIYVDTGALYRSIGLYAVRKGKDYTDGAQVTPLLPGIRLELKFVEGTQRVFLNGEDVSDLIRTPEIAMAASGVSAIPAVRDFLFDLQRDMAKEHNVVMDGRDIGTVVLPDADVKIFLTASPEARARRRFDEHAAKGEKVSYDDILRDVITRDYNDSHRAVAPLKQASDALLLDTTDMDLKESIQAVKDLVAGHLAARK
ncbi:(d)CMP kinase [Zongyangia hominis]|uniref:Cytidylate kinase n=1 Tax=Zongyangia hominis TaxID=2763677 RepID=A0A926ECW6_9FIRM|nr:(d)CMP kinase [Zongyangia hominis]MBC8570079.1 (d)CMP kinase [Zongyangia hominis]